MKVSYKVLKNYIKKIKSPEELANDLIMHAAEVEDIIYEGENLKEVYVWEIISCVKHENSYKLNVCIVNVWWKENIQIVCWANNVKGGIKVPVAVVWANLTPDFIIAKTKIRWEVSNGMICSEDELWLIKERQEWIMILPDDAPIWVCIREYLSKDDVILEVDNKAINHRPDLFSHIWIIREIYTILGEKFNFNYENLDFSSLKDLGIKNEIPDIVKRYIWLKVSAVKNIETPEYIKRVISSADNDSKWLLVDLSNYSLYLYGQPTHMFDADKIKWNISIRYAKEWEKFLALDDKEYELSSSDIVIADKWWVIALGWVIWGKDSAITDKTTTVIIEWAHFNQAVVRKTWKRLWIRTDSLNVFEKDTLPDMAHAWVSLIVKELQNNLENVKLESWSDIYPDKQKLVKIPFDINFINKIIWKEYDEKYAKKILNNLGIEIVWWEAIIPFWRKDLNLKADLAEEISRIDGYDNVETTIPRVNLGAVKQNDIYNVKNDVRNYLTSVWFFDMYNYSFVNEELMWKVLWDVKWLVEMKNALSEDLTHMRWSLIPSLLSSLEKNNKSFKDLNLFEIDKVFKIYSEEKIIENYNLSWVITSNKDIVYYDIQELVSNIFNIIWVDNFYYDNTSNGLSFSHSWRTADIIVRWKVIWQVWEIHPKVVNNFDLDFRIWFFEVNVDLLKGALYWIKKTKELSEFQENNFDINFVINKDIKWKDIKLAIEKTDINLIKRVELFDIYENEEKLPWKRSLSFKIFIQSLIGTLDDKVKNELIDSIIKKVEKKGWSLR